MSVSPSLSVRGPSIAPERNHQAPGCQGPGIWAAGLEGRAPAPRTFPVSGTRNLPTPGGVRKGHHLAAKDGRRCSSIYLFTDPYSPPHTRHCLLEHMGFLSPQPAGTLGHEGAHFLVSPLQTLGMQFSQPCSLLHSFFIF